MSSEDPSAPGTSPAPAPAPEVFGPTRATPDAAMPPSAPNAKPAVAAAAPTKPWGAIGCVLFGLVVAAAVVLSFSLSVRDGVVVGVSSFLAAFGLALAVVSLIRRKRAPAAIGGVAVATLSAALAAVCAAGVAFYLRDGAAADATMFDLQEAGLGAYLLGQAQQSARTIAWFGLLAVPGFSFGALGLIMAYGERKDAKRAATSGATGAASSAGAPAIALITLIGAIALFLGGVGATSAALVSPVNVVEHPVVPRLREVQTQLAAGDLGKGCDGLEALLPEKVAPRALLEVEIPGYREFAHRCVTVRIDALPKGIPCTAAAGSLLGSELTVAARAEARVKHACDRPF